MKCPKCSYLGFETGDRCRNCGYDFSLLTVPPLPDPDLALRMDDGRDLSAVDVSLPLFSPDDLDDAPLIALPAAPRAPLAVRRPAENPRLRAVPRMPRSPEPEAALDFREEADEGRSDAPAAAAVQRSSTASPRMEGSPHVAGRRVIAAVIDHGLLLGIDAAVVYFTLKMAGLTGSQVLLLPAMPLLTFIVMVKVAYFTAFTAVGGQTIGKMALGIRVVSEAGPVDGGRAVRRTLAALLSVLPLGLGFLPALIGSDRRALHDRLTRTRVIGLPSA